MRKTVDVITSAYNEEDCLPELFRRLALMADSESSYLFRFIVIDNGSHDLTWSIIEDQGKTDPRYVGIKMSRNFALDAAFTCGIDNATADVAIIMTSDLQDPPEAISLMLRMYESGHNQVLAKIINRDSVPFLRRKLSGRFYKLANFMTGGLLPESVSDFRLVSKPCYEAIRSMRESHRFLRGLGSWVGFKTAQIEIERPPRFAGESKWLGTSLIKVMSRLSEHFCLQYIAARLGVDFWSSCITTFRRISFHFDGYVDFFWSALRRVWKYCGSNSPLFFNHNSYSWCYCTIHWSDLRRS